MPHGTLKAPAAPRARNAPERAPTPAAPAPEAAMALAFASVGTRAPAAPPPPPGARVLRRKCAQCAAAEALEARTGLPQPRCPSCAAEQEGAVRLQRAVYGAAPTAGAPGGTGMGSAPASAASAPLYVGAADDPMEREADQAAERVMGGGPGPALHAGSAAASLRRDGGAGGAGVAPPQVHAALAEAGRPLDPGARVFMEARFGRGFGGVRVHTGGTAEASTRALGAQAYTVGTRLVFGAERYRPETGEGRRLIAHELAHTVQQGGGGPGAGQVQRYTPAERAAMAAGQVTGQADDLAMAATRRFQPGDIVFRLGSTALGLLTGEPVTHGGIYVGGGVIHDVVGFGNRHVRVTQFFNPALGEAANPTTFRVVRFKGPLHTRIVARLLANIAARNFRMPTDPVPFNLFSSAGDYRTATCLEYAHAQFLHAIRELSVDPAVPQGERDLLRATYFTGTAAEPNALVKPNEQRLVGDMPELGGGMSGGGSGMAPPPRTPSALLLEAGLMTGASALATDVDPARFSNRSESTYTRNWPGGSGIGGTIMNILMGPLRDQVVLRTFTYSSFVDSRQFFEDVPFP